MPSWYGNVLQLDGDTEQEKKLAERLKKFDNKKLPWTQDKVNEVWKACETIYDTYGIEIDPCLLLAIIVQEGTGSFNTSSTNKAADGQNGVEADYATDLLKANSLIFGKVIGYMYYHEDFNAAVASSNNVSGNGDIFQYLNWKTPIIKFDKGVVTTGCYAGHSAWGDGVKKFYEEFTYEGAAQDYSDYVENIDTSKLEDVVSGIDNIPEYNFSAVQNGQNSRGVEDGTWTVIAK